MENEFRNVLGAELRRYREKKRLSQPRVAKMAGIHPNSVYQYENGRSDITVLTLAKLCLVLDVKPATILKKLNITATKGTENRNEENPAA